MLRGPRPHRAHAGDRPDLDPRAVVQRRALLSDGHGLRRVGHMEIEVTPDGFLGLREWAVPRNRIR